MKTARMVSVNATFISIVNADGSETEILCDGKITQKASAFEEAI